MRTHTPEDPSGFYLCDQYGNLHGAPADRLTILKVAAEWNQHAKNGLTYHAAHATDNLKKRKNR